MRQQLPETKIVVISGPHSMSIPFYTSSFPDKHCCQLQESSSLSSLVPVHADVCPVAVRPMKVWTAVVRKPGDLHQYSYFRMVLPSTPKMRKNRNWIKRALCVLLIFLQFWWKDEFGFPRDFKGTVLPLIMILIPQRSANWEKRFRVITSN